MPIILAIIALVAALGVGGYVFKSTEHTEVAVPETVDLARPSSPESTTNTTPTETEISAANYTDGTYSATATYLTPKKTKQNVNLSLTIANDVITDSKVTFDGEEDGYSNSIQENFAKAYMTEVVGKNIAEVSLSRVGGASLTTNAFNEAVGKIATEAKA